MTTDVVEASVVIPIGNDRVLCAQSLGCHLDCDTAIDPSWPEGRVPIVGRDIDRHCLTASLRCALIEWRQGCCPSADLFEEQGT